MGDPLYLLVYLFTCLLMLVFFSGFCPSPFSSLLSFIPSPAFSFSLAITEPSLLQIYFERSKSYFLRFIRRHSPLCSVYSSVFRLPISSRVMSSAARRSCVR